MSQPKIMTLFDAAPPRRLHPMRAGLILALVGFIFWSGTAACLWTNESMLVFQARRSRLRALGSTEGVIQLKTEDGIGLDALFSAIDSVPAAASRLYFWAPVGLLASQRFDSLAKAPRVTVPVLQVQVSSGPIRKPGSTAASAAAETPSCPPSVQPVFYLTGHLAARRVPQGSPRHTAHACSVID